MNTSHCSCLSVESADCYEVQIEVEMCDINTIIRFIAQQFCCETVGKEIGHCPTVTKVGW